MVGIVLLVVLALVVVSIAFYFATHKAQPTLTYTPPAVTADDNLSPGKSNNELIQDARIVNAGLTRDEEQQKAAEAALNDVPQAIGDSSDTSTTVEASRLSSLQTAFISESDRRLKSLNDTLQLLPRLTTTQQTQMKKLITDETTAITGLKAKAAAETTTEAFAADKTAFDKQYGNYLLAIAQTNLLVWANGQTALESKVNILGGKYQERLNDASSQGGATATGQTYINTYQAGKTTAQGLTADALKLTVAVKPGDYNANRSVLRTYYGKMDTAHKELAKAVKAASDLTTVMSTL